MSRARPSPRLVARRARAVATAPDLAEILRGTLGRRYVRCGKAGCRCQRGRGHGPVLYLSVSLGVGRTHQVTIAREAFAIARRYVQNYARLRRGLEGISPGNPPPLAQRRRPPPTPAAATR